MYKTVKALIVRRIRFGDAHARITALSEEGLISLTAYGVMSPKNKNFSSCQPYTLSELVLSIKGDSCTLSQASTIAHLLRQGVDFEQLSLANYVASLASETSFLREDAPLIFTLTCTALSYIDKSLAPTGIIKAVFELRLMASLGIYPDFSQCLMCHNKADGGFFSTGDGAFICTSCIPPENMRGVSVSSALMKAVEHLLAIPVSKAFGIRFSDPSEQKTFEILAERFSVEHLDCAYNALTFYKQNANNY